MKKIGFKFKKVLSKKEQQYNLSFNKFAFTKKKNCQRRNTFDQKH